MPVRMSVAVLIVLLVLAVLVAPHAGETQGTTQIRRVGFLSPRSPSDPDATQRLEALRQGLRELGYVEGQSIAVESRWAEAKYERLPGLASELVRLKMDVIVTYGLPGIRAARQATTTIPIVMVLAVDPVATGVVASLARPGGNITGISLMALELAGKQLEILREVVPNISRVAILGNPGNPGNAAQMRHAQDAARTLGVRIQSLEARGPDEIDSVFTAMTRAEARALIVLTDAVFRDHRRRIADLAGRRRLPMVSGMIETTEVGGLMSYGPNVPELSRHMATFVDKILRGAKPADLPVEQPTKFELVLNLKTAKTLGLVIPRQVLLRADRLVE